MHKGKILSTENFVLQPLTENLIGEMDMITEGVHRIFSNREVVKFNIDRYFKTLEDVQMYIFSVLNGYQNQTNYDYFLIDKINHRLAGTVNLISPKGVNSSYPILNYIVNSNRYAATTWLIEYYSDPFYWRKGIMSRFVQRIVNELFEQGATHVCALVDTDNSASIALLRKKQFIKNLVYVDKQGQELWVIEKNLS